MTYGVFPASGDAQDFSPTVISIVYYGISGLVNKGDHVILKIPLIEVMFSASCHKEQACIEIIGIVLSKHLPVQGNTVKV